MVQVEHIRVLCTNSSHLAERQMQLRSRRTIFTESGKVEVCLLLLILRTDPLWLLSEQPQAEAQPKLGLCSRLHSASAEE